MADLDYLIRLVDQVSAPARQQSASLKQLEAEFRKQVGAIQKMEDKQRAAASPVRALSAELKKATAASASAEKQAASLATKQDDASRAILAQQTKLGALRTSFEQLNSAERVSIAQARALQAAIAAQEQAVAKAIEKHNALTTAVSRNAEAGRAARSAAAALSSELEGHQVRAQAEAAQKANHAMNELRGLAAACQDAAAKERELASQTKPAADATENLAASAKKAGGATKKATTDTDAFLDGLSKISPHAKVAATALAAVVAVIGGGLFLAAQATAFRTKTTAALQATLGSAQAASETFAEVRAIADTLPITEAKAQQIAGDLLQNNVQRDQLGDALKAVATIEAVRGEEAAAKIAETIKKSAAAGALKLEGESLLGTGLDMTEVVAQLSRDLGEAPEVIKKKLAEGKIAADAGIEAIVSLTNSKMGGLTGAGFSDLSVIVNKVRETFMRFFEGVDFGPLVGEVRSFIGLFATSRPAGQAMKDAIGGGLQAVLDIATKVFPYVKSAILETIIFGLRAYIAFKPLIAQFKEFFAGDGGTVLMAILSTVGTLLGWVAVAAAYLAATVGTSLLDALGVLSTPLVLAADFISGFAQGILQGGTKLFEIVGNLAKKMLSTIKGVLGIASPSKEAAKLGAWTTEGMAGGVEDGTPDVQASMRAMVALPEPSGGGGGRGGAPLVVIESLTISFGNASNRAELEAEVPAIVEQIFEEIAMRLGGANGVPA